MEEKLKQIDMREINEYRELYLMDLNKLNHLKELLKECKDSMNIKVQLTEKGCILKSNLRKMERISDNRVHQVKGIFENNHEIKKLKIDNNELDSSCLKNPKYYNILFEREKENFKKVIISLISITGFGVASILFNEIFWGAVIMSGIFSIKSIHEYINEEQINSYFCGKLTRLRLNKFRHYLEDDYEYEKARSIENYNYNMSFLNAKEEILNSMIENQEKRVSDDVLKINELLNMNDDLNKSCEMMNMGIEKENPQKAYQFVKKANFN